MADGLRINRHHSAFAYHSAIHPCGRVVALVLWGLIYHIDRLIKLELVGLIGTGERIRSSVRRILASTREEFQQFNITAIMTSIDSL